MSVIIEEDSDFPPIAERAGGHGAENDATMSETTCLRDRAHGVMVGIAVDNLLEIRQEGMSRVRVVSRWPEGVHEIKAANRWPDDDNIVRAIVVAEAVAGGLLEVEELAPGGCASGERSTVLGGVAGRGTPTGVMIATASARLWRIGGSRRAFQAGRTGRFPWSMTRRFTSSGTLSSGCSAGCKDWPPPATTDAPIPCHLHPQPASAATVIFWCMSPQPSRIGNIATGIGLMSDAKATKSLLNTETLVEILAMSISKILPCRSNFHVPIPIGYCNITRILKLVNY